MDILQQKNEKWARIQSEVLERSKSVDLAKGYSVENNLNHAKGKIFELTIGRDKVNAFMTMKEANVVDCLMDMVIQGLYPGKTQCYFQMRGSKLVITRSYFGTVAVLKAQPEISNIVAQVVYKDDEYYTTIEWGIKTPHHIQKPENVDLKKLVRVYAVIFFTDGHKELTEMTDVQIAQAWRDISYIWEPKTPGKKFDSLYSSLKKGSVHSKFLDQMAMRTVINRACKMYVNTQTDSNLADSFNRTTANEYINTTDTVEIKKPLKPLNEILKQKKED